MNMLIQSNRAVVLCEVQRVPAGKHLRNRRADLQVC